MLLQINLNLRNDIQEMDDRTYKLSPCTVRYQRQSNTMSYD